jgi:hypothetical protein
MSPQLFDQPRVFGARAVHLPVSDDDGAAHCPTSRFRGRDSIPAGLSIGGNCLRQFSADITSSPAGKKRGFCRLRLQRGAFGALASLGGSLYDFCKLGRRGTGGALAFAFYHHPDYRLGTRSA